MAKLIEHRARFLKREIKTRNQLSIVLRNIHVGYLKRRRKRHVPDVKHQIFSVFCPLNCIMRFTRRKISNITEERFETGVIWMSPGRLFHMGGGGGEKGERKFWKTRGKLATKARNTCGRAGKIMSCSEERQALLKDFWVI